MTSHHDADPLIHMAVGQWRMDLHLGTGRYSEVFRAIHGESGNPAVVKVLRADIDDQREGERALAREEEVLSYCHHAGIPRFIRRGEVAGRAAIVIGFCPGHSILRLASTVPDFDRVGVINAVARLVAHVHSAGFAHGDVCLENLLMANTGRVYLTGFSNARRPMNAGTEVITRVFRRKAHVGGPFTYLAPEILSKRTPSLRSDVYAIGVCAYLLLTRSRPYPAKTKEDLLELAKQGARADILRHHPRMPRALAGLINRCVALDPEQRFEDAGEFADSLKLFFSHDDTPKPNELSRMFIPASMQENEKAGADNGGDGIRWID